MDHIQKPDIFSGSYKAALFDMDGVLTDTAKLHSRAWKRMFDDFLEYHCHKTGKSCEPFDIKTDYIQYVDGKLRYDGAASFLKSRGIDLPQGGPYDEAGFDSVCALGNLKSEIFNELFDKEGVEVFPGALKLLDKVREAGMLTAVVSASNSCVNILTKAGVINEFNGIVDGLEASRLGLPGKPLPHTFLRAAEMLNVKPESAVVIEDAVAGVQAGRDGGFGLVIGVDRLDNTEALKAHGADIVVKDPGELL